jgi:hypothetical protein
LLAQRRNDPAHLHAVDRLVHSSLRFMQLRQNHGSQPAVLIFDGEAQSGWDGRMRVGFSATGQLDTSDFG